MCPVEYPADLSQSKIRRAAAVPARRISSPSGNVDRALASIARTVAIDARRWFSIQAPSGIQIWTDALHRIILSVVAY
jgi:hypothetical protein